VLALFPSPARRPQLLLSASNWPWSAWRRRW